MLYWPFGLLIPYLTLMGMLEKPTWSVLRVQPWSACSVRLGGPLPTLELRVTYLADARGVVGHDV